MADRIVDPGRHKTLLDMVPAEMKMIRYVDGVGNDETRIIIEAAGSHYLMQQKVGTTLLLQKCSPWLEDELQSYGEEE